MFSVIFLSIAINKTVALQLHRDELRKWITFLSSLFVSSVILCSFLLVVNNLLWCFCLKILCDVEHFTLGLSVFLKQIKLNNEGNVDDNKNKVLDLNQLDDINILAFNVLKWFTGLFTLFTDFLGSREVSVKVRSP